MKTPINDDYKDIFVVYSFILKFIFNYETGMILETVIAVVQDKDSNRLSTRLSRRVPGDQIGQYGGFLKAGNTTFMIGIEDDCIHT